MNKLAYISILALTVLLNSFGEMTPVLSLSGGISDYAETPSTALLSYPSMKTIEMWIYPTQWRRQGSMEKYGLVMCYKGLLGSHADYNFSLHEYGKVVWGTTRNNAWLNRNAIPLNQWTHMAITVNQANKRLYLYINGFKIDDFDTSKISTYIEPSNNPLYIGGYWQRGWGYNNNNFIGQITEIRVWNVEKTQGEIFSGMNKRVGGNEPGLIAYWNFIGYDGSKRVSDLSNKGHTMTLKGNTTVSMANVPITGPTITNDPPVITNMPPIEGQSPFPAGVNWTIPGIIEAENYDKGGQGVAYNESTHVNIGTKYRGNEGVDIAQDIKAKNGYVVGWTTPGEWIEYTVQVNQLSQYGHWLQIRAAGKGDGGKFKIRLNGRDVTPVLNVPNTGAWDAYNVITFALSNTVFTTGIHTMQLYMVESGTGGFVGAFDRICVQTIEPVLCD
jgi:hypothetical protein